MVDITTGEAGDSGHRRTPLSPAVRSMPWALRRGIPLALAASVVIAGVVALTLPAGAKPGDPSALKPSASKPSAAVSNHTGQAAETSDAKSAATPLVTHPPTSFGVPAPTPVPVAQTPMPSVATLVAQVEAAGIVPGPTWVWSMGSTAGLCGVISGAGGATGCTSWSSGVERTVFAGAPTLALVAHEVANAETEKFADPALLQEVSTAEAGTSWSPTDAVASCLVMHFLGFQDGVAGSWQCPAALAASVAAHIHDVVLTTQTTAICGTSSGMSSSLTFTASAGTLTVTSPPGGAVPQVAAGATPVTVTGVGTFTATDVGGTATVAGTCQA
jgi:hypothetical protein